VKKYIGSVEALWKREKDKDETQVTTKIDGFVSSPSPPLMVIEVFLNLARFMTELRVVGPVFSLLHR
jgi:hypothetical protein